MWSRAFEAEKAMAPHSSTLAWKIPWMEEPGRLQSMGSLRVGYDWATSLSLSLSCIGEGNGNPLQYSCLENPKDSGAWWAAVYGVAQGQTQLKRLSSSSRAFEERCPGWIYMHESGAKESSGCKYRGGRHKHIIGNQICRCGCPLLQSVCRGEREDITGWNGQKGWEGDMWGDGDERVRDARRIMA